MKVSDEDLEKLLRACVRADGGFQGQVIEMGAAYRARQAIAELFALRKVAEAASRGGWVCDDDCPADCHGKQLSDALKEAGYVWYEGNGDE